MIESLSLCSSGGHVLFHGIIPIGTANGSSFSLCPRNSKDLEPVKLKGRVHSTKHYYGFMEANGEPPNQNMEEPFQLFQAATNPNPSRNSNLDPSPNPSLNPSPIPKISARGVSGRQLRRQIAEWLREGENPIALLQSIDGFAPAALWGVVDFLKAHGRIFEALQVFEWWKSLDGYKPRDQHYTLFIHMLGLAHSPDVAQHLFDEMLTLGIKPSVATYSALLQGYAESGFFDMAEKILKEMTENSVKPNVITYTALIHAYGKHGLYDDMARVFDGMKKGSCCPDVYTYCSLIQAYAKAGLFQIMERTWREMEEVGWRPTATCVNTILQVYADAHLVKEMSRSYAALRNIRYLISKDTFRVMASNYIYHSQFYQLKQFAKDNLSRKHAGVLIWNLLLLSYAANFQTRHMQREFQSMAEKGFKPDLTTFNIRALSFSRMQMFWDLYITVRHMVSEGIVPDIVTFGAVVDAYLNGGLSFGKLYIALDELRVKDGRPESRTDPLVLEAFGKGDFHHYSEVLMQSPKPWTYAKLTRLYLQRLVKPKSAPLTTPESFVNRTNTGQESEAALALDSTPQHPRL